MFYIVALLDVTFINILETLVDAGKIIGETYRIKVQFKRKNINNHSLVDIRAYELVEGRLQIAWDATKRDQFHLRSTVPQLKYLLCFVDHNETIFHDK